MRLPIATQAHEWERCRFLTCSVLPVRRACNCRCHFCFSRSSISALGREAPMRLDHLDHYYLDSRERGATRLVITGGGEPLLRPDLAVALVERGAAHFDEIALFTNGARLNVALARRLADAGLTYLCWSRHHHEDATNRALMGEDAPRMEDFLAASDGLRIRATCVMAAGYVEDAASARAYAAHMARHGIVELTFKHTYVAYERSVYGASEQNEWARAHRVSDDPFEGEGDIVGSLPWGPRIRRIGDQTICHYHEPNPDWERRTGIARSINLLTDGSVYASLEDAQSLLYRLN